MTAVERTRAKKLPTGTATALSEGKTELATRREVSMSRVEVPVVHVALPAAQSVFTNVRWTARTVASAVPQPERLLYYGGVGVLAAFGVLEWPVALAAAAGVWVATHSGRHAEPLGLAQLPEGETRTAARPAVTATR